MVRTVRLLRANGLRDIVIVGPDERYKIKGSQLFIPRKNPDDGDLDKFLNSQECWNTKGRTLIVYGDVYFTDDAIRWILGDKRTEFVLHARPFNSHLTGTPWGECFALSFYPRDHDRLLAAMRRVQELYRTGIMTKMGGWEVYRAMLGHLISDQSIKEHFVTGHHFSAVNDWTDDFDYPEDYDRFIERRKAAGL